MGLQSHQLDANFAAARAILVSANVGEKGVGIIIRASVLPSFNF